MKRFGAVLLTVGVLAVSLPAVATAQEVVVERSRGVVVSGYLTHYFNEADDLGGGGARVMLNLARLTNRTSGLVQRSQIGAFVSFTQADGIDGLHISSEYDLHLFTEPVFVFLDPFVTVGAGVLRASNGGSETNLTLSPGAGAYFNLLRGSIITFRGDLRYAIPFGDIDPFFEAQGGVGIRF